MVGAEWQGQNGRGRIVMGAKIVGVKWAWGQSGQGHKSQRGRNNRDKLDGGKTVLLRRGQNGRDKRDSNPSVNLY